MINKISSTVDNCTLYDLHKIQNKAGNITALENDIDLPFQTKRVYYLYDIPGGESRGGHAHLKLEQFIVAVSGSFDVVLDDGRSKKVFSLNRPYIGLHIVPGIWRELQNFSSGAICLVLASQHYTEKDYIREYDNYLKIKTK